MPRAKHDPFGADDCAARRAKTDAGQGKAQNQRKMDRVSHGRTISQEAGEGNRHAKAPPWKRRGIMPQSVA
ncbi:hypothetical protein GCM10011402_19580 [Paracoccus acridae]|uniref:Uncharacterized protein n=1 Tax=Paracoccus acridae TaxID=1795310 RepID=A0ABQ1VI07_9RHOB|nr:hypothetical protein GCM10011402_19580 [Paracoccus acridae]